MQSHKPNILKNGPVSTPCLGFKQEVPAADKLTNKQQDPVSSCAVCTTQGPCSDVVQLTWLLANQRWLEACCSRPDRGRGPAVAHVQLRHGWLLAPRSRVRCPPPGLGRMRGTCQCTKTIGLLSRVVVIRASSPKDRNQSLSRRGDSGEPNSLATSTS